MLLFLKCKEEYIYLWLYLNSMAYRILAILMLISIDLHAEWEEHIDSLKADLDMATEDSVKVRILNHIAFHYINNDYDLAKEYAYKTLALAQDLNFENEIIDSYNHLGEVSRYQGDFEPAFEYCNKALAIALKNNYRKKIAETRHLIGFIYKDIGDLEKASEYFFNALEIYEELDDKEGISTELNYIGFVYYDQLNYDKAIEYYKEALTISLDINFTSGITRGYNNVAAVYDKQGKYEDALSYFYKALEINRKIGNRQSEGINLYNIGFINERLKNIEKAREYYYQSLKLMEELGFMKRVSSFSNTIGILYYRLDSLEKAEEFSEKAMKIGEEIGAMIEIMNASENLYKINMKKGNIEKAMKYHVVFKQMSDSVFNDRNSTKIARLELQHEFNKKQKEEEILQQRREFRTILIIVGLFFLLVILVLFFIIQRIRAKRISLEKQHLDDMLEIKSKELEIKNKELTTNVMYLVRKNELLNSISEELIATQNKLKPENRRIVSKVIRDLQSNIDDNTWKEFEVRFEHVHTGFYDKLNIRFPNLTPNEKKLCAFLRLNMTTKDISAITQQSIKSIEVARTRLRKKLGLSNKDINIVSFLSGF